MKHKGKLVGIILLVLVLCLGAYRNVIQKKKVSETLPKETEQTKEEVKQEEPYIALTGKEERDGFDEKTNKGYSVGGVDFSVPAYYDREEVSESEIRLYADSESPSIMLILQTGDLPVFSEVMDNVYWDAFINGFFRSFEDYNLKRLEPEDIVIADHPGKTVAYSADMKGKESVVPVHAISTFIGDPSNGKIIVIGIMQADDANYSYFTDYDKIIASATWTAPQGEGSMDGVRADFKKAMDSYEAFFDEYVKFMKEYQSSSNAIAMLNDYMQFLTKYTETMKELENMDTSNMTPEELAYYTEVMLRINEKLYSAIS